MKNKLSVYFGESRTYSTILELDAKVAELKYISSEKFVPNLSDFDISNMPMDYIFDSIPAELRDDLSEIRFVLPNCLYHYSMLTNVNLRKEEFKKLCELEIRLNFQNNLYEDFTVDSYPLFEHEELKKYILISFLKNLIAENCKLFFSDFNVLTERINPATAVVSALKYNYPEIADRNCGILEFGLNLLECSGCSKGSLIYHSRIYDNSYHSIYKNIMNEFDKMEDLISGKVEYLFLYGEGFTPQLLESFKNYFKKFNINVNRLNSFRMLTTKLGSEYREYCNRMAHVFPACIGAVLK